MTMGGKMRRRPGEAAEVVPVRRGRPGWAHTRSDYTWFNIKEDHEEVTLGILIKIHPNLLLDLSPITFGRIDSIIF